MYFLSQPGDAGKLKLQPFDSELKTTSGCCYRSISKKTTPNSLFSFYHYRKIREGQKSTLFAGFIYLKFDITLETKES